VYREVEVYLMFLEDKKLLLVGRINPGGSMRIDLGGYSKSAW